jgi:hypothetical protein
MHALHVPQACIRPSMVLFLALFVAKELSQVPLEQTHALTVE